MATRDPQRRSDAPGPASVAGRGVTWLVFAAVFAVGAGMGFGGAYLRTSVSAESSSDLGRSAPDQGEDAGDLAERMLALDPFIVNLAGDDASRYLKVRVELEAETPLLRAQLENRLPQVRDGILSVLSARSVADVSRFEGKALLKQDIQSRVDSLMQGGKVRSVLFTEFVVQ